MKTIIMQIYQQNPGFRPDPRQSMPAVAHAGLTCDGIETSFVENPREHFKSDDCINYYDKEYKQCDVKERNHRHENRVDNYLQT